jgi:hypothetical protein
MFVRNLNGKEALFLAVKRPELEADHFFSAPRLKCLALYHNFPK